MRTTKTLVKALTLLSAVLAAPGIFGQTCASDADCSQGMICHSQTVTTCSSGAGVQCDPGGVCTPTPAEPPVCSDSTVNRCAYRWQLPCNRDADCGDGFVCQPVSTTTCSASSPGATGTGSASPGSASAGAASGAGGGSAGEGVPVPPATPVPADAGTGSEPICTTSTSYPGTCQSKVTTCTSDADCPAPWTCAAAPLPTNPSLPIAVDAGPAASPPPDNTAVTSKSCQPPSGTTRTGGGADGTGGASGTLATSADAGAGKGATPPPPPTPVTDGGVGNGPSVPPTQGAADTSVDGGVGKGTTPSTPPTPSAGEAPSTSAEATPASTGGGGCSVVSGGVPSPAAIFFGLLTALALLTRKRA